MSFKTMRLVEDTELERLRQAAVREYSPVQHTLANIRDELSQLEKKTDIDPEQKLILYSVLKSKFDALQNVYKVSVPTQPVVPEAEPLIPPLPAVSSSVTPIASTSSSSVAHSAILSSPDDELNLRLVKFNIPNQYRNKFDNLYHYLKENKNIIRSSRHGELMVNGKAIEGSSWKDLIRNLFIANKHHNLLGLEEFLVKLREIHVPSEYISNSDVSSKYISIPSKLIRSVTYHSSSQFGKGFRPPGIPVKVLRLYK